LIAGSSTRSEESKTDSSFELMTAASSLDEMTDEKESESENSEKKVEKKKKKKERG